MAAGWARVVVGAAALGVALSACSSTATLRSDEVESAIVAGLVGQFPQRVFTASCPAELPAEAGGVFACQVTLGDGTEATVTVTQTDAEGDIRWEVTAIDDGAPPSASPSAGS